MIRGIDELRREYALILSIPLTLAETSHSAVTAIYKGTSRGGQAALLRSYDSRKEPPPENNCAIWQAGRATCATGLAFKPIQIGHSVFIDEGAGRYNPAPQILDEAAVNEWPGRDVGVFLSIGTGKRPAGTNHQQSLWWEGFVGSGMGDFAEARRRLISKIEGCEETHQCMLRECLSKRGVNPENYFRLNVEVGVGDFGMNEWNRLAEISTSTRRYLTKPEVQRMNVDVASKIARIHRAHSRHLTSNHLDLPPGSETNDGDSFDSRSQYSEYIEPPDPMAAELPAEGPQAPQLPPRSPYTSMPTPPHPQRHASSTNDKYTIISSDEFPQPTSPSLTSTSPLRPSFDLSPYRSSSNEYRPASHNTAHSSLASSSFAPSPHRRSEDDNDNDSDNNGDPSNRPILQMPSPPPLPPKTPLSHPPPPRRNPARLSSVVPSNIANTTAMSPSAHPPLPYPDNDDGPPPPVNMARKPDYGGR